LTDNDADLYVTRINSAQPQRLDDLRRFDPAKQTFYGSLQLQDMLRQFTQLRGDTHYDGVLLITDDSSYELSKDSKDVPVMPAPLWMVHVGHRLPPGYDDATLKAIQDSGGGIATNILEVMQRLATKAALGSSAVNVVDGYAWLTDQAESTPTPQTGFEPVAARQLVLELSKDTKLDQPVQLDAIHAIAKTYDIVTPYSSMIVLVNDRQKEALKKAEAASDRFDRTVESGKEQLNQPSDPLTVSGVPEPEEWLLLGLVAIALLALGRYRHSAVS
jgi:putative PEP-CTERM system integral membrane protein